MLYNLSKMIPVEGKKNVEAQEIQNRLKNGRENFGQVVNGVFGSVMKISALDLTMHDSADKMTTISEEMKAVSDRVVEASSITEENMNEVVSAYESFTQTITQVSIETAQIQKEMGESGQELQIIVEKSTDTIHNSDDMKRDMQQLMDVLNHMNEVIQGINSISAQTNMLALNASIEAARAGEAGKGFAVVAEQIRNLADETKQLTANMEGLVTQIGEASAMSCESLDKTVEELGEMKENLNKVLENNARNEAGVADITDAITTVAASGQEIFSAVTNVQDQMSKLNDECETLSVQSTCLEKVSEELKESMKPVPVIEKELDDSAKLMGEMVQDVFYMLDNQVFINTVQNAILAHQKWLKTLEIMVTNKECAPLQTDDTKCAFGHFYYAMKPKNGMVSKIWMGLGEKHRRFHGYGKSVMEAIRMQDYAKAEKTYQDAQKLSAELIADFNDIIQASQKLEEAKTSVFAD